MHLITGQPKQWLPSKMPALNYSVTHRIRHSCSYCTANGWLEDQEQQFFYNGIGIVRSVTVDPCCRYKTSGRFCMTQQH